MDRSARLEVLEAENDRLRERNSYLESVLGIGVVAPIEFRLSAQETRVFGVIMNRELATKDAIMAALYGAQSDEDVDIKIVDVLVCKIRKKLSPFGIEIKTARGQGFHMPSQSKRAVSAMLSA